MIGIALLGQSGSGKDQAADYVLSHVKGTKRSLAGPLKSFAQDVFGFTHHQLWGPSDARNAFDARFFKDAPEWDATATRFDKHARAWLDEVLRPGSNHQHAYMTLVGWYKALHNSTTLNARTALQSLGTEFGRTVDQDIWIDYCLRKADGFTVVSDCRFINEAKKFREAGWQVWRILRPNVTGDTALRAGISNHPSEMEQKSYDILQYVSHEINNDGTLADLERKVVSLLGE